MKRIAEKLPAALADALADALRQYGEVQELSLRTGRNAVLCTGQGYVETSVQTDAGMLASCLQTLCSSSVYAYLDEVKNGFLTIEGGHRVGLCGTAVMRQGEIYNLKHITGINIRIAKDYAGCGRRLYPWCGGNLLLISPPRCGKTTMLRDLARHIGQTHKVSVIDERGEIAAACNGAYSFDMGRFTDVLSLCPKRLGIELVLRSMAPDCIVTDELAAADIPMVKQAFTCGVRVIATAHGDDLERTVARLQLAELLPSFSAVALLSCKAGPGTIDKICKGRELYVD